MTGYSSLLQPTNTDPLPPPCYFANPHPKRKEKTRKENHHLTGALNMVLSVGNQCAMSLLLVKHNSDFSIRHCDIPLIYYMLEVVKNLWTMYVKQIKYVRTCLLKGSFLCRICRSWHLLTMMCSYRLGRIQPSPPHPAVQVHSSWCSYTFALYS